MRIRTKLFLLLLALSLLPLILLGAGAYQIARSSVEGKVSEQLSKTRDELAAGAAGVFAQVDGVIDELETDRNFELYLRYTGRKDVALLREIIERTFGYHLGKDPRYLGVVATFPSGDNLAIFKEGLAPSDAPEPRRITVAGENIFCVSRIIHRGDAEGTLHFYFRPALLMEQIDAAQIARGRPVDGFLIMEDRVFGRAAEAHRPILAERYRDLERISFGDRVAAVGPVPGTPLYVGASMPVEEFLSSVRRVRNFTALIVIAAAMLAILGALFFSTTIVRPVSEMVTMTKHLADGDLGARLEATRTDELGSLARDFNHMAQKLQLSQERIEERGRELMRERARVELALNMCRNVLSVHGFEAQVRAVCEEIRRHFGVSRVAVYLVGDDGERIEGVAAAGYLSAYMRGQDYPVEDREGEELYRAIPRAAARGATVLLRDSEAGGTAGRPDEYACVPLRAHGKTLGVIAVIVAGTQGRLTDETVATIEAFADLVSLTILEAKTAAEAREAYVDVLTALAGVIEKRDAYTGMHTENVLAYSTALARAVGFKEEDIEGIRIGAILHDIGKVAMADASLQKKGALTADEFEEMKRHPMIGFEILSGSRFLRSAREIVRHHHERWDGTGYPDGLKGEAIPLPAQIVAIADSYDAMTTDRPYRKGLSTSEAIDRLREASGSHFNPTLVNLFIETLGMEGTRADGGIEEDPRSDALRLITHGTLTLDIGRALLSRCSDWLKSRKAPVVVNLLATNSLTDGGMWLLLRISWKCRSAGSLLILVAAGELKEKVLSLAADFPFRIVETPEAAEAIFQSHA